MNSISRNLATGSAIAFDSASAQETLRFIARLPAPEGLEDRVKAGLKAAPRRGRVLDWPSIFQPTNNWMRSAAAAAVVAVVVGGGWGIYSRVQPAHSGRVIAMPPRAGAGGGFSNAGAMRTPQTLNGPMLIQSAPAQLVAAPPLPVVASPLIAQPIETKPLKKIPAPIVSVAQDQTQPVAANPVSTQPAVSVAR